MRNINFDDYESVQYFQRFLDMKGINKQLERMGINEGRDGTGKQAYSEMMTIAGKTGTAISAKNKKDKLMSFCGFFPAENPEYIADFTQCDKQNWGN